MVEGKLLKGHLGRAGHFGHVSLDPDGPPDIASAPGSLEDLIGNCTIEKRSEGKFKTTHELIDAHAQGDEFATKVWLRSVRILAAGVASFINILDPEIVIIGGGIARAGDLLFTPLMRELDALEWRPHGQRAKIVPAKLGEFAGALGAARNGMQRSADLQK
jgi:glucokinase